MFFKNRDEVEKRILIKLKELTEAYLKEEKYDKALNTILEFFNKIGDKYNENYCSFNSSLEYIMYSTIVKETTDVIYIDVPISGMYLLWGDILLKENKLEESLKKYNEGLKYNPIDVSLLFKRADIYRRQNKLNKFYEETKELYKYIYDIRDLSRYYINLAYYYETKNNFNLAYILYFTSTQFMENSDIYLELARLAKKTKRENNFFVTFDEAESELKKMGIMIGVDEKVLAMLIALEEDSSLFRAMPEVYKYIRKLLHDITKDDKYL